MTHDLTQFPEPISPIEELWRDLRFYLGEVAADANTLLLWLAHIEDVGTIPVTQKLSTMAMESAFCQYLWGNLAQCETTETHATPTSADVEVPHV